MGPINPSSREEFFMRGVTNALQGNDTGLNIEPSSRMEYFLNEIIEAVTGGDSGNIPPSAREEMFLDGIADVLRGDSDTYLSPSSRVEKFMKGIANVLQGEDSGVDIEPSSRREYFLWEMLEAAANSGSKETVTGNLPLTLIAARAGRIDSLVRYGLCTQASTPTPSSSQDIKCNNGALKMVHTSGLPEGYRLLEYVGGSGSQYVITDLYLASTDVVECEYRNSSTTGYGAVYGIYKTGESTALYGNQTYYGYDQDNNKVDTGISVDTDWHSSRHDFVNGTLTIDGTTTHFTPWSFTNDTKNAVLSRYYNGSYGYNWRGYVRKFKVTRGNEVICNLLPAKSASNEAGLYDLISGNFYTATGGTLLEGNEVDDYELRVVGTPEVLSVTATGAATQTASVPNLFAVGDYADEVDIISGGVTRKVGVRVLDGTEGWFASDSFLSGMYNLTLSDLYAEKTNVSTNRKTPYCTHFARSTTWVGAGSRVGKIQAMTNVQGTESVIGLGYGTASAAGVADFKAWLAEQYAAGTPVIVLYPLEETTQESVTPQALTTAAGTNTVSATAEVSPLSGAATYIMSKDSLVGTAKVGTAKTA